MSKLPVQKVIAAARTERSPLYEYLWAHYDEISAALSAPVNWKAMADEFRAAGIRAGRDTEATAQSVRQTWHRVKAEKGRKTLKSRWKG